MRDLAGQHLEAAVGSCGRVQPESDPAPVAGCGHAARAEKPPGQACFVRLCTLPGSEKPESALQKPDLRVRCQVLRGIADHATSSALQKTRQLRHGLLRKVSVHPIDRKSTRLNSSHLG